MSHHGDVAQPEEYAAALRVLFQRQAAEEREAFVLNALSLLRDGDLRDTTVFVLRGPEGLVGIQLGALLPGACGVVMAPEVAEPEAQLREDQLVQFSLNWLRGRGARVVQAMLAHPDESRDTAAPLLRNGFVHITRLTYFRHALPELPELPAVPERLDYQDYAHTDPCLFQQTLARTYVGTLDCPELNGCRPIEDVVLGHRSQGIFRPERWWLAREAGIPVAVLLLTELSETGDWDLSYVGVVPEARRRGLGRELVVRALRTARDGKAAALTLSVDDRNTPAWQLYVQLGFTPYESRAVYLALPPP